MKKTLLLSQSAVFAAMICFAIFIHVPTFNGYVHAGDGLIYTAAMVLPFPYCIFSAAFGAALSDILSGYAIYAIPTAIIKSLNVCCFYFCRNCQKIICKKTIIVSALSGIVTIVGYIITDTILWGNFTAQLIRTLPGNVLQATFGTVLFIAIGKALENSKFIRRV